MNHKAVIGLGFGDEGKGLMTDYLCSKATNPLVVRFSGGQQAGHTVVLDGIRHVFSNFGSGSLRGIPTYWSKNCTIEPVGLVKELNILLGKNIKPKIIFDSKCPITTPYDIIRNIHNEKEYKHGSCGVGVGATFEREEKYYSLLFEDIFYDSVLKTKMELIKKYYGNKGYKGHRDLCDDFFKSIDYIVENKDYFFDIADKIPVTYNTEYIFEGSQGLLLDQHIGFFPHVTRSNTCTKNILDIGILPELFLVTRAYQTRHGTGPMTNESIPHNIIVNPNETNVTNTFQGNFRITLLDLDLLLYGINKDPYIKTTNNKTLVITCLDHVVNEYRFTHKGKIINSINEEDFVGKIADILNIKNVLISKSEESKNIIKI